MVYVLLPIRTGNPLSGDLVSQPAPNDIRQMIKESRSAPQIFGPGGLGKTTLTRQI
jgi:replication-associated recombination protein RarA